MCETEKIITSEKTLTLFSRCKNSCEYGSKVITSGIPCSTQLSLVLPKLTCLYKLAFIWFVFWSMKNV